MEILYVLLECFTALSFVCMFYHSILLCIYYHLYVCLIRVFYFVLCRYIALVSGLNVGSAHCDQLSLQLFINYITGSIVGGAADHCSNIVRLIVAGNSITDNPVKSSTAADDSKVCLLQYCI